ncbi:MAG: PKD domain-containing protein [Bacteroidetes bacterium]|nr:MAG: PKD domain-containing protein [Bacteroidota bacterium]
MLKRYLIPLSIVFASLFLMGSTPEDARAQQTRPFYSTVTSHPAGAWPLRLRDAGVPVRLHGVEGPARLAAGEVGLFMARANLDAASLPIRVRWDFGDGNTATSLHARHRFSRPGTYPVVVRLSNPHGATADTLFVVVVPPDDGRSGDEPGTQAASERGR